MKMLLKTISCMFLLSLILTSTAFAQLYRNTEYQFSIEIPDYMEYRTPREPNVKMSAYAKDLFPNIVIIVKPNQEIVSSNDEILAAMLMEEEKLASPKRQLKYADIISISDHEVLYTIWNNTYTRPNFIFPVTRYSFEYITNHKYYYISYEIKRGTETIYENMIAQSICSFIDETSYY